MNADGQAIVLLCSSLALPRDGSLRPLSPAEWARLAPAIRSSRFATPAGLLGEPAGTLAADLALDADLAERLAHLLARGAPLALELDRLESRGIWTVTRADTGYPERLRQRLGLQAPPVLHGVGSLRAASTDGVAIVGSRDASAEDLEFTRELALRCAREGVTVFSGGARGVDAAAMEACAEGGGTTVGVLADSLERTIRSPGIRVEVGAERLVLVTAFHPAAGFNIGAAMARNRWIYCLAEAAVVVSSSLEKGGTRAGALEDLRARWVPLFVKSDEPVSAGNRDLATRGAIPLTLAELPESDLLEWLVQHGSPGPMLAGAGDEAADPFERVWPVLERELLSPRSEKELKTLVPVTVAELRQCLRRAVNDGLVQRSEKPVRYRLAGDAAAEPASAGTPLGQPSLFDADETG